MTVEEIGGKIDGLGLWNAIGPYHWAICPRGTVFPYFLCAVKGDRSPVKERLLLLEGWQTFHDFIRVNIDRNYGFQSSPVEFAHFELVVLDGGAMKLFRHDPCLVPREADSAQRELCARMLWEVYGVMMRIESDSKLPLRFFGEKAVFARVEGRDGRWSDAPLEIPDPRPHVEKVMLSRADIAKAGDLPFAASESLELDFRMLPGLMTRDTPPRSVYGLVAVDGADGSEVFSARVSPDIEHGLRGMWESLAQKVLASILERGRVPGEIKLVSGRTFRMLRPLGAELPFKLSMHDALPRLEAAYGRAAARMV